MLGWMKHKLESRFLGDKVISLQLIKINGKKRFLGETSITSDTKMTPLLWQKVKN